jgi:precorrin-6A synthase
MKIWVIGIGAGDPEQVTMQAVRALGGTDVFFVLDKGAEKSSLIELRTGILTRYGSGSHRVVVGPDPERDRGADAYTEAVEDWRRRRADVCERMITDSLGPAGTGAFLVWGDPTLYDSTLGIIEDILARGRLVFEYAVVPGVSSVSTLVARHRVGLNRIGRAVQITTGRRLAAGWPADVDDVVVMLDARTAFASLSEEDRKRTEIYWGAYLGTPDEILISGLVADVAEEIVARRAAARAEHGWIMDTYLLRRLDR